MKRHTAIFVAIAGAALLAVGCTSSTDETTTTTAPEPVTTTVPPGTTTTSTVPETTTTTLSQLTPPEYEIVGREALEEDGDELVVLLDPTSYQSLTDLDLYDIIAEVVSENPSTSIMHVVDTADAARIVADPDASETDLASIDDNYLARLEGDEITYLGPFASSGEATLGS